MAVTRVPGPAYTVCTSSTRPSAPFEGQHIYETDTDRLMVYNGSQWNHMLFSIATSGARPSSPPEGQTIYETDTDRIMAYDGTTWQHVTPPGSIIQTIYARSDTQTSYSSAATGDGTTVTELNLTIAPRYSSSYVLCQWMINGEMHQDNVFLIHKGGTLQTSPAGYNTVTGNSKWSGMMSAFYDQNEDSTQSNWKLMYMDTSLGSTSSRTYAPAVRSSNTASTFYLNRTVNAASQAAYERTVSIGIAMEIKQ